jgi:hypothetical protein
MPPSCSMHLISYVVQCSLLRAKKFDVIMLALVHEEGLAS